MRQHDSQLAYHVLLYAIQALSDGDLAAIEDLDFTADEIRQLSQLPVKALRHLSRLAGHFVVVKTDHACFAKMMNHLHHEIENEALQDELLRHEAPIAMMNSLFGLSSSEYIRRQKLLGIPRRGAGRPALLAEEEETKVWQSWTGTDASSPQPQRFLQVARETGLPLRTLWSLIQSWENSNGSSPKDKP